LQEASGITNGSEGAGLPLTGVGGHDEIDGLLRLVVIQLVEELRIVKASLLPSCGGVPSGLMFVSGVQGL
jgi:hypothetical protein